MSRAALGPAGPLPPGLDEIFRLFVEDHGVPAVTDTNPVGSAPGGKLDVLGEGEEIPAAHALQQLPGEAESGAVDGAGGAEQHPGLV